VRQSTIDRDTNVLPDRPEIRGMINRVPHLITVEEVDGPYVAIDRTKKRAV
jgi:hypothetical protein